MEGQHFGGQVQPRRAEDFDALYAGVPPWDIGRPQPTFLELAASGRILGRVLDVGCGTGEHALMAAAMGLEAYGVDIAPAAIALARQKAVKDGLTVDFVVGSALDLPSLRLQFDTVLDSGLFHIFEDDDRPAFVDSLRAVLRPGGQYHMLCFSDKQPGDWGPRRIPADNIRTTFGRGWRVDSIVPARMALSISSQGALAWRASIARL